MSGAVPARSKKHAEATPASQADATVSARNLGTLAKIEAVRPAAPVPKRRAFNLTDSGNAEYFAARFGRDLRFDHRRQRWLVYLGNRWTPDQDGEVLRRAKSAMRKRLKDAADIEDVDKQRQAVNHALASESRGRLAAMLSLARAERPIADAGDRWDADPWLLGTPNGVIELRTGTLRAGRREDHITMSTAVPFDPQAQCPRFLRFLEEVFNADQAVISFVHHAIGYSLTGLTTEHCFFVNYGTGANGKTTLLLTLMYLLGDYALTTPFSTVELRQRSAIPNDLAALVNRRFVIASETNDDAQLNEARVKALTGGDRISARFLHGEWFEFIPAAKFWFAVNHRPVVRDDSHGFWRRVRLIPFTQTFPVNATLSDELRLEAPGILAWAVRGCLAWQQQGLTPPSAVLEATHSYERDSDSLAGFLEEACDLDPDSEVGAIDLFNHYKRWAERQGLSDRERLTGTGFGRKVAERFSRQHTRAGKVYRGIAKRHL